MEIAKTVTRKDVELLKIEWIANDRSWDIEETEGFHEYKEELKYFKKYHEPGYAKGIDYYSLEQENNRLRKEINDLQDLFISLHDSLLFKIMIKTISFFKKLKITY